MRLGSWLLLAACALAALGVFVALAALARRIVWRAEEGRHHAFGGVRLRIEDDGRHVWIDGAGLMRATGRHEPEDVLAARHSGRWRRDGHGVLMLRVDAVVQVLDAGRGRDDPRVLRLKHYLERQVLFPAAERRRRGD